jgi:hypothetical protein
MPISGSQQQAAESGLKQPINMSQDLAWRLQRVDTRSTAEPLVRGTTFSGLYC